MKKILLNFLFLIGVFSFFIFFKFGSALTQEKNTIPILISILQLEISNQSFEKVSDTLNEIQYVSKHEEKYSLEVVKEFMGDFGWIYKEQMGSGLTFIKNGKFLIIETRQYSKDYYLWKVKKDVLK